MHVRRIFVLTILSGVWLLPHFGARAVEDPLQSVYARMDKASANFKSLRADMKKLQPLDVLREDTIP